MRLWVFLNSWRYDGSTLTIYRLFESGYSRQDTSLALPALAATDIARFLALRFPQDSLLSPVGENSLVKQFRQWLRDQP